MSVTYSWKVSEIHADPAGTVSIVRWKKTGSNDSGSEASFYGATTFRNGDPSSEGYVPLESLTEDIVLGWVQAIVVGDYETRVNEEIQGKLNSQPITKVHLPWGDAPSEPASP